MECSPGILLALIGMCCLQACGNKLAPVLGIFFLPPGFFWNLEFHFYLDVHGHCVLFICKNKHGASRVCWNDVGTGEFTFHIKEERIVLTPGSGKRRISVESGQFVSME